VNICNRPSNPNYYEINYDENTTEEQINSHIKNFTSLYGIPPRATRLVKKFKENNKSSSLTLIQAQKDSQSLSAHEKIILEILGDNHPYLINVIDLHRNYYLNTLNRERSRSRVRLLNLKFSNIYCYGQNNLIDFTTLERKISGAIAPNRAGKSALIDIVAFALYDEYPRADKKVNIINERSSDYYLLLEFEIDGKVGYIEKSGRRSRGSHLPECRFVYDNEDLTQGTSTLTCKEIEKLVGNYFDAQLTSISHQGTSTDFVHLKPNERKKALSQLLALGSFEKLEKIIKDEHSQLNFEIKLLEKGFRGETSEEIINKIKENKEIYNSENLKIKILDQNIENKKQILLRYIGKREQIFFNYCQIKDKLSTLNPEKKFDLNDLQEQLKNLLAMTLEKNFSPEEELEIYSSYYSENNLSFNLNLEKILTRKELSDFINSSRFLKDEIGQKERIVLLEIKQLELEKIKISTLIEQGLKKLKENYHNLEINFEEIKLEIPVFNQEIDGERP
jgi:DNA repair exonuclease SbcCD ATPase subunit